MKADCEREYACVPPSDPVSGAFKKKSNMHHSRKLSRREVLQDQTRRSASKVEGGKYLTLFVIQQHHQNAAAVLCGPMI